MIVEDQYEPECPYGYYLILKNFCWEDEKIDYSKNPANAYSIFNFLKWLISKSYISEFKYPRKVK